MFDKLWGMLQQLENAKGSKAKSLLLKDYVNDEDFVWMAKNALDQGHSFGVEEIPPYDIYFEKVSDAEAISTISSLKEGVGVDNDTLDNLHRVMCSSENRYNVMTRILRKDLRCGVAAKTINKVAPGLIFKVSYQRCASADYASKIDFKPGAILQTKANGMFAYLLPDGSFMTRKGERSRLDGNVIAPFVAGLPTLNKSVLAMELLVLDDDGNIMNRAKGNGLINSLFKGGGDIEVAARLRAQTWLYMTETEFKAGQSNTPYRYMWDSLGKMIPVLNSPIKPIDCWYVKSLDEAMAKTKELIRNGEEGTVLKSMSEDFFWCDEDPSYFQVKLKAESECEFEIIGAYEGDPKKKYAGMLGGITIKSADGVIVSDCGGGFTDEQRKLGVDYWIDKVGSIVTVKFNGITEPNEDGIRSLDHPRLIEIRSDKTEADTYEQCRRELLGVVDE